MPAGAGEPHFAAGTFEVVRIDEVRCTMSDHFIGPVTEAAQRAWTYPANISLSVCDQNQIQRGLEQPAPLFRLLVQRLRLVEDIRFGLGAFLQGGRKPSQHQKAE